MPIPLRGTISLPSNPLKIVSSALNPDQRHALKRCALLPAG